MKRMWHGMTLGAQVRRPKPALPTNEASRPPHLEIGILRWTGRKLRKMLWPVFSTPPRGGSRARPVT